MGKSKSPCFYGCGGPLLLLLLLLLPSQDVGGGGVRVSEARVCQSQSHGFHGSCVSHHNCALVCRHEGFSGGRCRGFRHRCFCTKVC